MKQSVVQKKNDNSQPGAIVIAKAVLIGFLVSGVGVSAWSLLFTRVVAPWSSIAMVAVLYVYWKLFSGKWGRVWAQNRQHSFRAVKLPAKVWIWGLIAAACFVVVVQSSFVITFRILEFPAKRFTADYKILDRMPLWSAWLAIVMGSVVAGISEETGFRGYMQAPLEKKYGPLTAIAITSGIFTLMHLSHSWAAPIIPHIFFASILLGMLAFKTGSLIPGIIGHSILDIFDYSIWWSDITGGFRKQTIFKTGIDLHFIIWILVFVFALFAFFRSMGKLSIAKKFHADFADFSRSCR